MARYEIERPLGQGGMGQVVLARQMPLGRRVALKVIERGDVELDRRFGREARLLAQLSHPHVVRVFDHGELDGRPFIAMEYIEGTSLQEQMDERGAHPPAEVDALLEQLLDALACLHELGIAHRDVKPANVMVDDAGRAILVDFGLARSTGAGVTRLTETGAVLGTVRFLAPEAITGQSHGFAADVWAAGCIAHEMLTGQRIFSAPDLNAVCSQILAGAPPLPPPRTPAEEARAALVARLLEPDPCRRPPDGAAALAALREMRAGARGDAPPSVVSPAPGPASASSSGGAPSALAWLAVGRWREIAALGVGGLLALAMLGARHAPPEPAPRTAATGNAAPSPAAGDPAEPIERALFRFRAGALLRTVCEKAGPLPVTEVRESARRADLTPVFAASPHAIRGLPGASPRGQALAAALTEFDDLRNILRELHADVDLPAGRGWPEDLCPAREPTRIHEVVTLEADPDMHPLPGATARRVIALPAQTTLAFWISPAIPHDLDATTTAPTRSTYRHPAPMPLRLARPGESVVLDFQVQYLGRGEQLAIRFTSAAGDASPWAVVNGSSDPELFYRIPATFLAGRDRLELDYRRCARLSYAGECRIGTLSIAYTE